MSDTDLLEQNACPNGQPLGTGAPCGPARDDGHSGRPDPDPATVDGRPHDPAWRSRLPQLVVLGAKATCSFGVSPATLAVIPAGKLNQGAGALLATVQDFAPMTNLATFGMCTTQSNPAVAAATSAALGTPTPAPCIPATSAPWSPGSATVTIGGKAALTSDSTCNCSYGGVISITDPGQTTVKSG
jgi:hypothetical protein